jgi:hypothetical protein
MDRFVTRKKRRFVSNVEMHKDVWIAVASVCKWPELIMLQMVSKRMAQATRPYYDKSLQELSKYLNEKFQLHCSCGQKPTHLYKVERNWKPCIKILKFRDKWGCNLSVHLSNADHNISRGYRIDTTKVKNCIRFLNICLANIHDVNNLKRPRNVFLRYLFLKGLSEERHFVLAWKKDNM